MRPLTPPTTLRTARFKIALAQLTGSRTWLFSLVGVIGFALAGAVGYYSLSREVTLAVDGKPHTVRTLSHDVRGVLAGQGITVHARDVVVPSLDSRVTNGTRISVLFSKPLAVAVDGVKRTYWTTATNVASALDELGIRYAGAELSTSRSATIDRQGMNLRITTPKSVIVKIGGADARPVVVAASDVRDLLNQLGATYDENDLVKPGFDASLADGERIVLTRVSVKEQHVPDEAVQPRVIRRDDPTLYAGQTETAREGTPGIRDVTMVQFAGPYQGSGKVTRNTCVIAPGRSDRSPTGTGTSARMAVLHARGQMSVGDTLVHSSIIGSTFTGTIKAETSIGDVPAIIPTVRGRAWITGFHNYVLDTRDPFPTGYVVADTWGVTGSMSQ